MPVDDSADATYILSVGPRNLTTDPHFDNFTYASA